MNLRTINESLSQAVGQIAEARKKTSRMDKLRKILKDKQYAKVDGVTVDLTTAGVLVQIYDKLSETNREKFASLPVHKMIALGWKLAGAKR